MPTGIYRLDPIGRRVEVEQKHIDFWCKQCQFPIETNQCKAPDNIQRCWNEMGPVAGFWHIAHECPFLHINQPCQCNDFQTIQEAFTACDLSYKNPKPA